MKNPEVLAITVCKMMPREKVHILQRALERNFSVTGAYMLEHGTVTRYAEGYYIRLTGNRASFSVFYSYSDGFIRKPRNLHEIESDSLLMDESQFTIFQGMK